MTQSPGTRIRELRVLSGMSQEELGRRIGVQRAAINKYEKGIVENIPIKSIEKIADVFEVSPTYIVGWDIITDYNPLSAEVKIIQGIKHLFGKDAVELLEHYDHLTPKGKARLHQYLDDIYWTYKNSDKD